MFGNGDVGQWTKQADCAIPRNSVGVNLRRAKREKSMVCGYGVLFGWTQAFPSAFGSQFERKARNDGDSS